MKDIDQAKEAIAGDQDMVDLAEGHGGALQYQIMSAPPTVRMQPPVLLEL